MDIKKLAETLHPLEKKVLPVLGKNSLFSDIVNSSGLKDVEVMRALQWLQNKGIIQLKEEVKEMVFLDKNGEAYAKEGLPEKRFLAAIKGSMNVDDVIKKSGIDKAEVNICLGMLKKKAAIDIKNDKGLIISLTDNGKRLLGKDSLEEEFLKKKFPVEVSGLKEEEKFALENLKKRKEIVKAEIVKTRIAELTADGKTLLKEGVSSEEFIDRLTPKMIVSGAWKDKKFRRYDVQVEVPKVYPGKQHFVNDAVEYIKKIWLELGFKEMEGRMIDTSFWNFDALFTAQDHPVREMQDTFFIKEPAVGRLPDRKLVDKIKAVHENGGDTGSTGWQYKWDAEVAKKLVARTHTTVLSAHTIAALKESDLPVKYFSVNKCFRNETLDWSHLFELTQVEGIVVDPNANFKHLLGYIKEFYNKMGYSGVRIRPAYFPYTEPSCEVDVLHPVHKKWVELGGAGIFRPEVVKPLLGKDIPVLAWGQGLERGIMEYFNMNDIRDLYKNDLRQLRTMKAWLR